ncbi:unnamed protein product (macronuclear) [Paramecium tetraurelia]|uniref:Transmembrane protein n=1 Tax=Paramecium tetraurelia TaxID=5888 RepID=A0C0U2_PARTE|nr:uncharacterized protein GSPATT00033885001 [Paramecium tetraurelia]CAK64409.1 unnamed protein product [Paramecium tetraurelia]|eukprot:XP_001431807.1 hypothetical protein (macronuclear) [Paramecium tetraurelia strain d4-2]
MHKLKLQFLNQDVEDNYIKEHQFPKRRFYLKVSTIAFQILLFFKLIVSLIEQNYTTVYPLLISWGITLPFVLFPIKTDFFIRMSISLLNILYIGYLLFFDPQEEAEIMYFKGSTQMAANVVNIFVLEFIDSSILSVSLLIMRVTHLIYYSPKLDLPTIVFAIGIHVLLILMIYVYQKALRSQYLLTKTDQRWENILKQIIHDQKFILLNFDKEKIQFKNISSTFSKNIQTQDEVISFIRNSKIKNLTLEQYLYQNVNDFQSNCIDSLNNIIMVTYDRQFLKLNFSIFFGNQPTILIQKDIHQYESNLKSNQKVNKLYLNIITSLIKIIKQNKKYDEIKFQIVAKKLFLKNLISKIETHNFSSQLISFKKILHKAYVLTNKKCQFLICQDFQITTIPKIFDLFLALLMDCSHNEIISIKDLRSENQQIAIKFGGALNIKRLKAYLDKLEYYFLLIFQNIKYDDAYVTVKLNEEIFVPFKNLPSHHTSQEILHP